MFLRSSLGLTAPFRLFGGGLLAQPIQRKHPRSLLENLRRDAKRESTYILTRWMFLRLLGLLYLGFFLSLWGQVIGLIGEGGILPAGEFLTAARSQWGVLPSFWHVPTLFWLGASDAALQLACSAGVAFSLLAIAGAIPQLSFLILWGIALSFVSAGQVFFQHHWDYLLLEVGFLAIFFESPGLYPGLNRSASVSPIMLVIIWWVLFRALFESGVMKIITDDPSWQSLTAFQHYFETQPLPTVMGWYAHHSVQSVLSIVATTVLVLELVVPFFLFGPRRWRLRSFVLLGTYQLLVFLTGGYGTMVLVLLALCVFLLDDAVWIWLMPAQLLRRIGHLATHATSAYTFSLFSLDNILGVFILVMSALQTIPSISDAILKAMEPFHVFHVYSINVAIPQQRMQLVVEGSRDKVQWKPYTFRYLPASEEERPRFTAPHVPRLDIALWQQAQRPLEDDSWFHVFLRKVLEGQPEVLGLLRGNPFPGAPPKYVRTRLVSYSFADTALHARTGKWWVEEVHGGLYSPIRSLLPLR